MPIVVAEQKSPPAHEVKLTVEQSDMTVTVKAGTFKVRNVVYALLEDFDFEATPSGDGIVGVCGYLAKELATDAILVVVDERVPGDMVEFDWDGSPYERLYAVFDLKVPSGAASLDDVDIVVHHTTGLPVEPAPEMDLREREPEPEPEPIPPRKMRGEV